MFSGVEERVEMRAGLALRCWSTTTETAATHTMRSGSVSVNKPVHTQVDMATHTHTEVD